MEDDDAGALLDLYGDPLVMRYTDEPPFPDLETVALMLASVRRLLAHGESLEWAVVLRDGPLIGTCGLHSFDPAQRTAEVGFMLTPAAWGRGHMAEAIGLLTCFAKDDLRLRRLTADVASENHRAQRFLKKLGYTLGPVGMLSIDLG
ncbi:GNAT family N-acetyltransferase [Burkholderia sp. LMU1-1-1.1]